MIWKLLHRLFGFDFVLVHSFDDFVRRVKFTPTGRPYVKFCGGFVFLDDASPRRPWTPLTFQKPAVERPQLRSAA